MPSLLLPGVLPGGWLTTVDAAVCGRFETTPWKTGPDTAAGLWSACGRDA